MSPLPYPLPPPPPPPPPPKKEECLRMESKRFPAELTALLKEADLRENRLESEVEDANVEIDGEEEEEEEEAGEELVRAAGE